jgi:zinc transporter, ZIP family
MTTSEPTTAPEVSKPSPFAGASWLLALIPLVLLGAVLFYLLRTGGGMQDLAGPPVEQLSIERITLPEHGVIEVEVINDGPQEVIIAQVNVDEAYWMFEVHPSAKLERLDRATVTIPYPWVDEEAHEVVLFSSLGTAFVGEIPVAVLTPEPSSELFGRFGLIGLYVGIVPIVLGLLWYPFMRDLGKRAMNFILSLTVGLLIYLAVGTWLDAMEFAAELPAFWQGVPLVVFIALLTLGALLAIGAVRRGKDSSPLSIAYLIALGIGFHNLGEGLAIGAAYALGEAALGTFLVLGFTLHNITEGVGIAAPIVKHNPGLKHFALLALLAGGPAIIGTWIGGFAFNPVLATIFLAIGVGAILQVVWEVGRLVMRESERLGEPALNWVNLAGLFVGVAIMYFTAFFVKF